MKRKGLVVFRNVFLVVLLAFLCIGSMELIFCRVEDPALFEQLVAPAENLVRGIGEEFRSLQTAWTAAAGSSGEDGQFAGDPAIESEFIPADPAITELAMVNGQEYQFGGNYALVYFNQTDEEWADAPFGIDPVGTHGCGPTALAIAVSTLTGVTITPAEMAAWAADNGYAAPHSGSFLSIVEGTAENFGLDCVSLENADAETLRSALSSGGIVVALMGPGHFTRSGHFILLHGVTLSGEFLIADPHSRENTLMTWDPALLLEELSTKQYNGSPLWLLTPRQAL